LLFFHLIAAQNLEPSLHQKFFMLLSYIKLYLKNGARKFGEVNAIFIFSVMLTWPMNTTSHISKKKKRKIKFNDTKDWFE
jgi:hypothetical protein